MDSSKSPDNLNLLKGSDENRKLFKVSYRDMDLSKDPYSTRLPRHKTTVFYGSSHTAEFRHLVMGHSQIRDKWRVVLPDDELNFPMDWISVSGGKAKDLAMEIVRILQTYKGEQPLRISAIIWQNSVESSSLEDMKSIAREIQEELDQHTEHKVAFPSLHFIPQQEACWGKIGDLNDFLREVNIRNGLNPYNIHKSTMKMKKGEGLRVQQSSFEEYKAGTGKGYHIAESRWSAYVRIIKKYHQMGFRDHEGAQSDHKPRHTSKITFMPTAGVRMKDPRDVDLRKSLNDIRSRKKEEYGQKDRLEGVGLVRKIAADSVEDGQRKEDSLKQAYKGEMQQVVMKIVDETLTQESKRKHEEEEAKEKWVEEKRKTLQKMNHRLIKWESHGRIWEDTLIKQERDLEAKEKDMEMREAEAKRRHLENLERYKTSDLKLKIATAEKELELAKMEKDKRKMKKSTKDHIRRPRDAGKEK